MSGERFQAVPLVASPCYPNSVAWSDDNLIAVASAHVLTILNPNKPFGPRGLITLPLSRPFPIGLIQTKDLLSDGMLPISLSRDIRPCVRSISWSPIGFTSNSGCLLAVCTTEGRVKLYRFPFCEFSAEWVEVMDISEMLYTYLENVSFWELDVFSTELEDGQESQHGGKHRRDDLPSTKSRNGSKRRRQNKSEDANLSAEPHSQKSADACKEFARLPCLPGGSSVEVETSANTPKDNTSLQIVPLPKFKLKGMKRVEENENLPLISKDQYTSRNSMLSSLVAAWSPILSPALQTTSQCGSDSYSILAVGAKSGMISFWKIRKPEVYSIMHGKNPTDGFLIGFIHAHSSWVTTISWELSVSKSSSSQLLLATGSSDGSVKIWQCCIVELLNSSESRHCFFSLYTEVIAADSIPVSVLSLAVPVHSTNSLFLAVGKGSGSLDVWMWEVSTKKFHKAGPYDAHGQIITGFAWAFDGNCLYSCSQDDSVRCWILSADSLSEVPLPSNTPGVKCSTEVPAVFDSCFGLAKSPGSLVVAVARTFDADLLNPMYQARSQKAAVEFFWIGGQQVSKLLDEFPDFDVEAFPGFSEKELVHWEHNILWSLKQHEHLNKPLVIWDIVAALLAFKQFAPKYVNHILVKWLRSHMGSNSGQSFAKMLSDGNMFFCSITSRHLQLLNIISRRVILKDFKADKINSANDGLEEISEHADEDLTLSMKTADEQVVLWMKLLKSSEKELRERLVFCSFSAVIVSVSQSTQIVRQSGHWQPVGLAQQEQWVERNHDHVRDCVKVLKSEVGKIENSKLCSVYEYIAEEQCSYCSAYVPFESAETALCQGVKCNSGVGQKHKLSRCSVSMLVNPVSPSWFCVCCHRWASNLAPEVFFTMPRFPKDGNFSSSASAFHTLKPLCPFCGIQLQRLQPEFLLSPSPI